mmetsp:Transcript_94313/g.148363  ORF Transcript_94313/g.148363 Transcript_94313/m.148363 type:complete len:390 (+) Transcript_94313:60-1229(+)
MDRTYLRFLAFYMGIVPNLELALAAPSCQKVPEDASAFIQMRSQVENFPGGFPGFPKKKIGFPNEKVGSPDEEVNFPDEELEEKQGLFEPHEKKQEALDETSSAACDADVPKDTRILLHTLVQANHGSTAVQQFLMSSKHVSSLCSGKTWQCEGFTIAGRGAIHEKKVLSKIAPYWNMARPVLMDKLFPDEKGYTEAIQYELQNDMPTVFADMGINNVKRAYIIMWTPLCVRKLAKSPLNPRFGKSGAESEVGTLEQLKELHTSLLDSNKKVIVISYADLLWRPKETAARLVKFLPCAKGFDGSFVPEKGVDVFNGNLWHVHGSTSTYGEKHDSAECCGYNIEKRVCEDRDLFERLEEKGRDLGETGLGQKMEGLQNYFRKYDWDEGEA